MKLSRREFIKKAVTVGSCVACERAAFGMLGPQMLHAQSRQGSGRNLVLINLFGGFDGLNFAVPIAAGAYYDRRPTIAVARQNTVPIAADLGINSLWSSLGDRYLSKRDVAIIEQVGYPEPNRSHFESQDIWSLGVRTTTTPDQRGWIGRLADSAFDSSFDVVGIGVPNKIDFHNDRDSVRPLVVNSLESFGFDDEWSSWNDNTLRRATAEALNRASSDPVAKAAQSIYSAAAKLKGVGMNIPVQTVYPASPLGTYLKQASQLMRSDLGTQLFYTGIGGWDTHGDQTRDYSENLSALGAAIDAFVADLEAASLWDKTCIVIFSEFGRNCFENGTLGTDHGHGNSMVVLGGGVKGGIFGPVPSAADLSREYLDYAIDFRAVFRTVIDRHLGLDPDAAFPERITVNDAQLDLFRS